MKIMMQIITKTQEKLDNDDDDDDDDGDNEDPGGTQAVKVETAETVKVPTHRRLVVG